MMIIVIYIRTGNAIEIIRKVLMEKKEVVEVWYMDLYRTQVINELARVCILEQKEISFWCLFFVLVWSNLI